MGINQSHLWSLRNVISLGLVSKDPNVVLLEMETCWAIQVLLMFNPSSMLDNFKFVLVVDNMHI